MNNKRTRKHTKAARNLPSKTNTKLSKTDEAFLDAAIALWRAQERVTELDYETGATDRDRDRLREAMRYFMRIGNEARIAEWKNDNI